MKRIMLFARDPGGANTIIPLIAPLKQKGYKVHLYGKDAALTRYTYFGLSGRDISACVASIDGEHIKEFLKNLSPDFIISGTSGDDFTERYLWQAADQLGIKSFAILDSWMNYGIRFSPYRLSEWTLYEKNKIHPYLPYKVLVMDNYALQETIKEGINASRLLVSGQPYFEFIKAQKDLFGNETVKQFRQKVAGEPADIVIVYVSEPIIKCYGDYKNNQWGYDEKIILDHLINSLEKVLPYRKKISLWIKQHPLEEQGNHNDAVERLENSRIKARIIKHEDPRLIILASDLVCGMSSMLLLESIIMQKPTISIQIGLKQENPLVLARRGIIKTVLGQDQLINILHRTLVEKDNYSVDWQIEDGAKERIINYMEELLCHN